MVVRAARVLFPERFQTDVKRFSDQGDPKTLIKFRGHRTKFVLNSL